MKLASGHSQRCPQNVPPSACDRCANVQRAPFEHRSALTNRKRIKLHHPIQTPNHGDAVVEQAEVLQLGEGFKALYRCDLVEAQVQPSEVCLLVVCVFWMWCCLCASVMRQLYPTCCTAATTWTDYPNLTRWLRFSICVMRLLSSCSLVSRSKPSREVMRASR